MPCFAPLLLLGYALTLETSRHHTTNMNSPAMQIQSCEKGLGMAASATGSGLLGLVGQYGWRFERGEYGLTLQPSAGLSYAAEPVEELPQRGQFQLGFIALAGLEHWRMGVQYQHLSNAGMKQPNIGIDLLLLQIGWSY